MKKIRRLTALFLSVFLLLSMSCMLSGCGEDTPETKPQGGTLTPGPDSSHTHVFGPWEINTEPACETEGYELRFCECGAYEGRALDKLGHAFENGICTRCNVVDNSAVPGELEFTLSSDGASYAVTGVGTNQDKDLVIPESYNGLPVTTIEHKAFYNCAHLESVSIPSSVKTISGLAFAGCVALKTVVFSEGLQTIHAQAFVGCEKLQELHLPASLTVMEGGFEGCASLNRITVAAGNPVYTAINNCVIRYDESGKGVLVTGCNTSVIPADGSIATIAASAFSGISGLKELVIPEGVTRIEHGAFANCTGLVSVYIPDSVTELGENLFEGCSALVSVRLSNVITSIPWSCFANCSSLREMEIPASVTELCSYAFGNCTSLAKFHISANMILPMENPFQGCASLVLTLDANNPYYTLKGNCLMENNDLIVGLSNASIPQDGSVFVIGELAFAGVRLPSRVELPAGLIGISGDAFRRCTGLQQLVIPQSVEFIDEGAFYGSNELTELFFAGTMERWSQIVAEKWNRYSKIKVVHCSDGDIILE